MFLSVFSRTSIDLTADCNKFCQCSTRYYKPVCSVVDQQTYYTPCHAGCSDEDSYVLNGMKVVVIYPQLIYFTKFVIKILY